MCFPFGADVGLTVVLHLWSHLHVQGLLSLGQGVWPGHTEAATVHQLCTRAGGDISGSLAEKMELWFTLRTMCWMRILLRWQKHTKGKLYHPG